MPLAFLLAAGLASSPAAPVAQAQPAALLRVYVKTDDRGEGSELAARRQSVTDMSESLAAKKKTFTIVETEALADVIVEVVDRALYVPKVVMGIGPRPGDPSSIAGMAQPVRSPVLRVRAARGRFADVFTNKNKPSESPRGWKMAADDVAGQIEKWAKANR
jgi:hypothetical protein